VSWLPFTIKNGMQNCLNNLPELFQGEIEAYLSDEIFKQIKIQDINE
jgi:hypothetical protein